MIVVGLSLLGGIALGVLLSRWWAGRKASADYLAMPAQWPLQARMVVNDTENKVWHGLRSIFHDHVVIVKIPVLRFTRLHDSTRTYAASSLHGKPETGVPLVYKRWLERLEGVYATFTVCTMDGRVVGCVDVPGSRGFSKASSKMKEALLLDCGIAYTVAGTLAPSDAAKMRELFLGELAADALAQKVTRGGDSNFYSELTAFTLHAAATR